MLGTDTCRATRGHAGAPRHPTARGSTRERPDSPTPRGYPRTSRHLEGHGATRGHPPAPGHTEVRGDTEGRAGAPDRRAGARGLTSTGCPHQPPRFVTRYIIRVTEHKDGRSSVHRILGGTSVSVPQTSNIYGSGGTPGGFVGSAPPVCYGGGRMNWTHIEVLRRSVSPLSPGEFRGRGIKKPRFRCRVRSCCRGRRTGSGSWR